MLTTLAAWQWQVALPLRCVTSFILAAPRHDRDKQRQSTTGNMSSSCFAPTSTTKLLSPQAIAKATSCVFDYTQAVTLYNTKKYAECVAVCRKGVKAGDAKAQSLLGTCYVYGHGVAKGDRLEALRLAKLAAAQNEPLGLNLLGLCQKDPAKAGKLYREAAAYGCSAGQTNLGNAFMNGTGVPGDKVEGMRLMRKAAAQGDGVARHKMGKNATTSEQQIKFHFQAATAPQDQIDNDQREKSVLACASVAKGHTTARNHYGSYVPRSHHARNHSYSDAPRNAPKLIEGIQLCVDEAVADANAASSHATTTLAALNQLTTRITTNPAPPCPMSSSRPVTRTTAATASSSWPPAASSAPSLTAASRSLTHPRSCSRTANPS